MAEFDPVDKSWGEYRRLILAELERINGSVEDVKRKIEVFRQDDISQIKTDIALLKLQAAFWGAAASIAVTSIIAVLTKWVK